MSAPSPDSSVTGVGGEEILYNALQELGFVIERNRILRQEDGQEADAHSQWLWHQQVDAWKYVTALKTGHVSRINRAWSAWQQKYAPNSAPWQVEQLMWQASGWDLWFLTEIDFVIKAHAAEECDSSADFLTPFRLGRPGADSAYLSGRRFRQLFNRDFLVESTLANGSDVDKSGKLRTLNRLSQLRRQNECVALFYNGNEPGSPPARHIPEGTLVIYFAQQATLTYPRRLKQRMLEDTQQELRKEREEGKRKQEELENEVKRKQEELEIAENEGKRKQEELEIAENEVKRLKTLLKHEDAQ